MRKIIKEFIMDSSNDQFTIKDLEEYLIKFYMTCRAYEDAGGYLKLYGVIHELNEEDMIEPLDLNSSYHKIPKLENHWKVVGSQYNECWPEGVYEEFSDRLDLSYFKKHPEEQTCKNMLFIKRIYKFLTNAEKRYYVSVEERSLELFDDKEYLTRNRSNILSKVQLNRSLPWNGFNEALKMRKYNDMFIHFHVDNQIIERVLIIENISTFFSYKRLIEEEKTIMGQGYDLLICGEGEKIIKSLNMLPEFKTTGDIIVEYFGDLDEGSYYIYKELKERYTAYNFSLHKVGYCLLLNQEKYYPSNDNIKLNQQVKKYYISELDCDTIEEKMDYIWKNNLRIPQEVITYELLRQIHE